MYQFQAGTASATSSSTSSAPDFSTLPMAALVCIMQHVPLRSRMGSISRVCTAWADAAAAATTTFDLEMCSNHSSLAMFLWKHGRLVTSMELRSSPGLAQLPCPKLLRLSIQQCSLHMAPGSQLARDIASATQLSSIRLNQVVFQGDEPDLASVLGALPNLQELVLHKLQSPTFALYPAVTSLLQQLPGGGQMLTRLELQADDGDASFRQPATVTPEARATCRLQLFQSMLRALGSLPSLQHLELDAPEGIRAEALDHWRPPPGLTALHLGGLLCSIDAWPLDHDPPPPGRRRYSGPALRHLSLSWLTAGHTLGVQHLAGWSQLQSLRLCSAALRSTPAQGVELLCVLPHLEQLTALVLDSVSFGPLGANPAAFSALLSHSRLQHLEVSNTSLPWQHMTAPFAASQTKVDAEASPPQCLLQSLHLNLDNPSLAAAVSARDVEALLACCTGLRTLHIRSSTGLGQTSGASSFGGFGSFGGPSFLPALHALRHLTSLATSGVDDVTVWSLVRLTGLRELRVLAPSDLMDAGLKALTSLQKLTALDLCPCRFSGALFKTIMGAAAARNQPGEQALWRISTTGTWTMPDVWQQLQAITSRPPARSAASLNPSKGPAAINSNSRRRARRPAEQQLACSPRLAFGTQLLEAPGPGFPLHYLDAKASQHTTAHFNIATNQSERPPSPDTARQLEQEPLLPGGSPQLGDGCQGELREGEPGCLPGVQRAFVRVAAAVRRGSVRLQRLFKGDIVRD